MEYGNAICRRGPKNGRVLYLVTKYDYRGREEKAKRSGDEFAISESLHMRTEKDKNNI